MDPEIEGIIKEQVKILPIEVKSLLADPGLKDKIFSIGKKNGLDDEQLETLRFETNLVILGLVHPDEYPDELRSRLNVDEMKTDNILNDINREILNGIREKLIGTFEESDEMEEGDWMDNMDFILSGGDYSALIAPTSERAEVEHQDTISTPPTLEEIKRRLTIK